MVAKFERRVSVGRTEGFEISAVDWAAGETITAYSLAPQLGLANVVSSTESGGVISFTATGVAAGAEQIHVVVETATRDRCETAILVVVEGC